MTLPSFVVNVGNCWSSKLESFDFFFLTIEIFSVGRKKNCMVVNYKPSSSTFHTRLVIAVTQNADIFVTFIAIQFFFREGNKFCMVVLCDTTTWTCGNIKAKLLWLSKKGKICSSLILTIRIFFLAVKKKLYGDKLQVKLFCFSEKVGKVVTRQTADIYVKIWPKNFFYLGDKKFCMVVLSDNVYVNLW